MAQQKTPGNLIDTLYALPAAHLAIEARSLQRRLFTTLSAHDFAVLEAMTQRLLSAVIAHAPVAGKEPLDGMLVLDLQPEQHRAMVVA